MVVNVCRCLVTLLKKYLLIGVKNMRAVVCEELGTADKLVLRNDWDNGELGPHDIIIDVKAAGLNFPDTLIIEGKYQIQPELPFIPGGECSGVVSAIGENWNNRVILESQIHETNTQNRKHNT
jgi:NADPH2:quinone reductase